MTHHIGKRDTPAAGLRVLGSTVGLLLALAVAAPASGQMDSRFTLVAGAGYEPGGPGPALVDAMKAADLDDVRYGKCLVSACDTGIEHPFHSDAGIDLVVFGGLRYRAPGPFSAEVRVSNGQRGHAEGYSARLNRHLVVSYTSFILSATGTLHLGPLFVEAGPALNRTGWGVTRNSTESTHGSTLTLGGVATVGGEVRAGAVLISLKAGLRQFPELDLLDPVRVQLRADYRSILIGFTVTRWVG